MVLVLVSRKVKGIPVGVEPTFSTCSSACAPDDATLAKITAATNVLNDMNSPLLCQRQKIWHALWRGTTGISTELVMAGLVPAIHVFAAKTWMPGIRLRQGFGGFGAGPP
jgi:hypothetical protein